MTRRLVGVQYLRGMAALMVAYFHMVGQVPAYAATLDPGTWFDTSHLACGVDIFFVISGFIMVVTSQKLTPGEFMRRRPIRIIPLYWLLTLALAAVCLVAPSLFRSTHLTGLALLKSLLFIPYFNHSGGSDFSPLLAPGWSLDIEMFFYLVFALTLTKWVRPRQDLAITVIFIALVLVGTAEARSNPLVFYSQPRVLEFCAGAILGRVYLMGNIHRASAPLLAVMGLGALLAVKLPQNGIDGLLPALSIVCAIVALECASALPWLPWLARLGDASYSIYLTHVFALGALRVLWERLVLPGAGWAVTFAVVSIALVAAVGLACYRLVEMPMLRACQRMTVPA